MARHPKRTRSRFTWTFIVLVLLLVPGVASARDDGVATLPEFEGPFPDTKNIVFLGQVTPTEMGALPIPGFFAKGMLNDIWGWGSSAGQRYALVTNTGGTSFVRITDPTDPVYVGRVPSGIPGFFTNVWGQPATFGDLAYFTHEGFGDFDPSFATGITIVDLSALDGLGAAPSPDHDISAALSMTTVAPGGYGGAHNIVINETTGYAYVAGVHLDHGEANNACGIQDPPPFNTLILDLNANPWAPTVAACLPNAGEHDFHVVNYDGPDTEHEGKEILFVFDGRDRFADPPIGGFTEIWDVTDKSDIQQLARFRVPQLVFSHNGWTTDDRRFLYIGDEVDELVMAGWEFSHLFAEPVDDPTNMPRTGTYIVDVSDLDAPVFVERYEDTTVGLDHNFMVHHDKLFIASYTSGTRVLQIDETDGSLSPFAHMDTEPRLPNRILNIEQEERFGSAFLGQWGMFVFDDGLAIASDSNNGLIVFELSDTPCKGMRCNR